MEMVSVSDMCGDGTVGIIWTKDVEDGAARLGVRGARVDGVKEKMTVATPKGSSRKKKTRIPKKGNIPSGPSPYGGVTGLHLNSERRRQLLLLVEKGSEP